MTQHIKSQFGACGTPFNRESGRAE